MNKKTVNKLLTQDARIIILKYKGTDSAFTLNSGNRKKRGIFSIITGFTGLTTEGISAYLNWKKNEAIEKRYQPM